MYARRSRVGEARTGFRRAATAEFYQGKVVPPSEKNLDEVTGREGQVSNGVPDVVRQVQPTIENRLN